MIRPGDFREGRCYIYNRAGRARVRDIFLVVELLRDGASERERLLRLVWMTHAYNGAIGKPFLHSCAFIAEFTEELDV